MSAETIKRYWTVEKYLELERDSETKYEYYDGEIVAMAGAAWRHNCIVNNLIVESGLQLRGKPCRGVNNDQRVKVADSNQYYYPDFAVVCGKPQFERFDRLETLLNPTLIVEVLSESTGWLDLGKKKLDYQRIESLQEYVVIWQDEPLIEISTRQENGSWSSVFLEGIDSMLTLNSIGVSLAFSVIYADSSSEEPENENNSR